MFIATRARRAAFTLIELLIVIAIIAILALIAVPNFLEAQVRAKVSRTHADMRSLSVAIEAYGVDWGRPALGRTEIKKEECHPGAVTVPSGVDDLMYLNLIAQSRLTTPVGYIGRILEDPFAVIPGGGNTEGLSMRPFNYRTLICREILDNSQSTRDCAGLGYIWLLKSYGPSRNTGGSVFLLMRDGYNTGSGSIYDSSNGTISVGQIIRTNKGVLSIPGH